MDNAGRAHARRSIRPFQDADEAEVVGVWHRSAVAAYTYLPTWRALTLERAQFVFHNIIRAQSAIWVARLDEPVVAYLAMKGTYIDRLYVDPREWRKGWGTQLVNFAKQLSPSGLELHTHQANFAARALYERHGFQAVKFGISPPPESAPDVEYHWRPQPPNHDTNPTWVKLSVIASFGDLSLYRRMQPLAALSQKTSGKRSGP